MQPSVLVEQRNGCVRRVLWLAGIFAPVHADSLCPPWAGVWTPKRYSITNSNKYWVTKSLSNIGAPPLRERVRRSKYQTVVIVRALCTIEKFAIVETELHRPVAGMRAALQRRAHERVDL